VTDHAAGLSRDLDALARFLFEIGLHPILDPGERIARLQVPLGLLVQVLGCLVTLVQLSRLLDFLTQVGNSGSLVDLLGLPLHLDVAAGGRRRGDDWIRPALLYLEIS